MIKPIVFAQTAMDSESHADMPAFPGLCIDMRSILGLRKMLVEDYTIQNQSRF